MTVPAYAAAGAGAATTTGTLSVPYPSGISAGHLLLLHVYQWTSSVANPTTPSGWTLVRNDIGNSHEGFIYSKTATGAESGSLAVTVTSSAQGHFGRMYRFTGDAGTWAVEATGSASTTGTDNTMEMPSITTTAADRRAVAFAGLSDAETFGASTGESGGDWTEAVAEYSDGTGSNASIGLQTAAMAAAGTISGGTATISSGGTPWLLQGFAIYVAAAAASKPFRRSATPRFWNRPF